MSNFYTSLNRAINKYYNPDLARDWQADLHCDNCEQDQEHTFEQQHNSTVAWCGECGHETDIELDYEDPDDAVDAYHEKGWE